MLFAAAVAALVSAIPLALAQDLSVSAPSLSQCAHSTINVGGANAPYYVAVVPAQNPCESDAIAEFTQVSGPTVDYTVALPEGTQIQLYIMDSYGNEHWSEILTVGGGDASCLSGAGAGAGAGAGGAAPAPDTPDAGSSAAASSTSSSAPSTYVAPAPARATTTSSRASSSSNTNPGSNNVADSPADAESSTSGGFTTTASFTLIGGAFAAAFALF
ncbi:hypothetical protein FRC17_000582 [Serendipita sp. 399]|nr:hypothetical protein FRC17_000582 [Serendipita sp. 399]